MCRTFPTSRCCIPNARQLAVHELVRAHRGRAGPHLVVEVIGRRRIGRVRPRAHLVIAVDLDQPYGAEPSLADDAVARADQVRCAAPLHADLHDALVFPRRREHRLPFHDVHAMASDPDVEARLHRIDHRSACRDLRVDQNEVQVRPSASREIAVVTRPLLRRLPLATRSALLPIRRSTSQSDTTPRSRLDHAKEVRLPSQPERSFRRVCGVAVVPRMPQAGEGQRGAPS